MKRIVRLAKRIVRRLTRRFRPKTMREQQEQIVNIIRAGGGHVGKNFDVLSSVIDLMCPHLLSIGDNVTITSARILTHDSSMKKALGYTKAGKVHIGNDVFIGWGAIVLPNTVIGDRVIIGAGTIVAKDIPSNSVVIGNPCRILCTYDEYMDKIKAQMENYPVIDLLPSDIHFDDENGKKLIEYGCGFFK